MLINHSILGYHTKRTMPLTDRKQNNENELEIQITKIVLPREHKKEKEIESFFTSYNRISSSMAIRFRHNRSFLRHHAITAGGARAPHISFIYHDNKVQVQLQKTIRNDVERTLILTADEYFEISYGSQEIRKAGKKIADFHGERNGNGLTKNIKNLECVVVKAEDRKPEHMYQWKINDTLRVCVRNRRSDGRAPMDTAFVVEVRRFNDRGFPLDEGIMMAWHNFHGTFVPHRKERKSRIQEMERQIHLAPASISSYQYKDLSTVTIEKSEKETEECSICLDKYSLNENCTTLSNCSHRFHSNCIQTWLKGSNTCPLCRKEVL